MKDKKKKKKEKSTKWMQVMKETKEIWQLNATSDWILNWEGGDQDKGQNWNNKEIWAETMYQTRGFQQWQIS